MEIISWNFLLFVIITLTIYYILNRKAQNVWLLVVSIFFIGSWGWQYLIPLTITGVLTFLIGKKLTGPNSQRWLAAGIAFNILSLVFVRFAATPVFAAPGQVSGIEKLLAPLGLSFYALQAISYLIDVRRGHIKPETDPVDFMLYQSFFLKFLAGPIERAGTFLPQLKTGRRIDNDTAAGAAYLIIVGLIRKVIIAQILISVLPENFMHAEIINTRPDLGLLSFPFISYTNSIPYLDRIAGIVGYGIYLYNDFAGYTGIMRGISLLLGIKLSPNFMTPYFSTSFSDFWSRWHISLSSWLRDYIYYPLSRSLKKNFRGLPTPVLIFFPFLLTMLASGLWHGATGPYLIWGLAYAVMMGVEQWLFVTWPKLRPQRQPAPVKILTGLLTFMLVTLAWVPFSAGSLQEIFAFLKAIFKGSGWNSLPAFSVWIVVLAAFSFLLDGFQSVYKDENFLLKYPVMVRSTVLAVVLLMLFLAITWAAPTSTQVFIYQSF